MTTTTETTKRPDGWNEAAAASAQAELEQRHPPRSFHEELPVRLTEGELAERAKRAAAARRRVAEYESAQKAAAAHWKAKIELAENERDELLDTIDTGIEQRSVECIEKFEWRTGSVIVLRTDTREKLSERAMTSAERQPDLPAMPKPEKEKKASKKNGEKKDAAAAAEPAASPSATEPLEPFDGGSDAGPDELGAADDLDQLAAELEDDDEEAITDPAAIAAGKPPKNGRRTKKG